MPMRQRTRGPVHMFAAIACACVLATGCGADTSDEARPGRAATVERGDLPGCGAIGGTLGGMIAGWKLEGESGPWDNGPGSSFGVSCTWLSPRLQSDNPFEVVKGGSLAMAITVDPLTQSEADVRSIGWVVDDAAVGSLGGHLVFPSGRLDFAAPLGIVGPQVVVGPVTVLSATGGVLLQRPEEAAAFSNRDAVDAAIAVHRLIGD